MNLARCHYLLKDYDSAVLAYKEALPVLREDDPSLVAELLLGLGYSRIQVAWRVADSDPEEASSQFTTAANDLNTILVSYKDSPNAYAAAFHRGQAFEGLGQFDNAKASFQQSLDFKKDDLKVEAMFALGRLSFDENEFEDASLWYDRVRTVIGDEDHRLLNQANLFYGEVMINIGLQRLDDNDPEASNKKFRKAKELLAEASKDKSTDFYDDALFLQASCSKYLDEHVQAAELFESVANLENSEQKEKALVLAGTSWLLAGKETKGNQLLQRAMDSESSIAIEAVHEKAVWLISAGRNQEAFDLTEKWIPQLKDHPLEVDVLLDRANASINVPQLADRSGALYAQIASAFPNHPKAPRSLFWSAVSDYSLKDYDSAIEKADTFATTYAGDDFLPDMREVRGDSLLMQKKYGDAETAFRNLATDFQSDTGSLSRWITRAGFASFLQGNFDETIEWFEGKDALITEARYKAEALHWIGSSHLKKEQFDEAVEKLQQSLDIDREWDRTPEVMFSLCRAQLKQSDFEGAEKTASSMLESFPGDPEANVTNALYEVGDAALEAKDYQRATRNFDLISSRFDKSELAPWAIYRAAFAAVESRNSEEASKRFADFLDKYPNHELAQNAILGRTNALRMSGNTDESIAALKTLLADADNETTREKASYELGLAYVDAKDWENAVGTFTSMTESLKADNPISDKVWYELAWAQRENGDADGSLKSFASLIKNHPNSSSAPEAHFMLGSKVYDDKQYDEAIDHFTQADSEIARDEIREKAKYKLGWCYYRKGNFSIAEQHFTKQAEDFPEGTLYANSRYMIAQCAYRADNFEKAFQAYTVAKPAIEKSGLADERVKELTQPTLLNGARSGNKIEKFKGAAEMAQALIAIPELDETVKQEALLELGMAQNAMGEAGSAMNSLLLASENDGETGAHATSIVGDMLFKQAVDAAKANDTALSKKKFAEAIEKYNEVYFGYSARLAPPAVKQWQAYATYESARCYMVQINDAANVDKVILIGKAIDQYQKLVDRFPECKQAAEAEKQLKKLKALKENISNQ